MPAQAKTLDQMSPQEIDALMAQHQDAPQPGPAPITQNKALAQMSPQEIDALIAQHQPKTSKLAAGKVAFEAGSTLGLRPTVAGVGSAIGQAAQMATSPAGGWKTEDIWPQILSAYQEGRSGAIDEQAKAKKDQPGVYNTVENVSSLAPASLILVGKGIAGAAKFGATMGAAKAVGEAQSPGEAVMDIGAGTAAGAAGGVITKAAGATAEKILNSEMAHWVLTKAEHMFGQKENPITNHLVESLEEYKANFDFKSDDGKVEKYINNLIDRVKSTPASQLSERDVDAIAQRVGPNVFHEAVQSGQQRLSDLAARIGSKSATAIGGAIDKYGPAAVDIGAAVAGIRHGGLTEGAGGAILGHSIGPTVIKAAKVLVHTSSDVAGALLHHFKINPLTDEGITRLMTIPAAREYILQQMPSDQSQDQGK